TYKRIVTEAEARSGRENQIEAARDAFYRGFVAEAIDSYVSTAEVMDASGTKHKGVLTAQDMADWHATVEAPQTLDYHDWTIAKTPAWGQGPVLLQSLALLKGFDIAAMDPSGPDFIHTIVEAMKLAFADREVYYGDPEFGQIPTEYLLSEGYN
ncbi:gamma-glutamyltransferase, partial [Rhizobium sp. BR5]